MAEDMINVTIYSNYKILNSALVSQRMALTFSKYFYFISIHSFAPKCKLKLFQFFSNFDLKKLPMTYNRTALERKFSFYYTLNDMYASHVSKTRDINNFYVSYFIRIMLCFDVVFYFNETDVHPQSGRFS